MASEFMTLADVAAVSKTVMTWEGVKSRVMCRMWLQRRIRRCTIDGNADAFENAFDDCEGVGLEKLLVVNEGLKEVGEFIRGRCGSVLLDLCEDRGDGEAERATASVKVLGAHEERLSFVAGAVAKYMAKVVAKAESVGAANG